MVDRIERELLLPAPTEEVWEVVTGSGWLAEEVELELVPGGEAAFTSAGQTRIGWVEEALAPDGEDQPGGRLVFWWAQEGEAATRVELTLEPVDEGTWIRVVEARPLDVLDVTGIPLPGGDGAAQGPMMVVAA
jgi:uncharacterized protein YndB with AHSA1/START domain